MANEQFKDYYATAYDVMYQDKDYEGECDYIVSLFKTYRSNPSVKSILDIACGTGGHAIPLAKRGFKLTAQDISNSMVKVGIGKAIAQKLDIEWYPGIPMQEFSYNKKYDSIICMFSAIDYVISDEDLSATFTNVRNHLLNDGLFIVDFWNAQAVEEIYSETREKTVQDENKLIRRKSRTKLNMNSKLAYITIEWEVDEDDKKIYTGKEVHTCRYFDTDDMKSLLVSSKLDVLDMHPFMDAKGKIERDTWNITAVCKK